MKKKTFLYDSLIVLLALVVACLLGLYILQSQNERDKLSELKDKYEQTKVEEPKKEEKKEEPKVVYDGRIICIGDSLTLGVNGENTYPDFLAKSLKKEVIKFGGSEDQTFELSARLGGYRLYVNNVTIPSSGGVEVQLLNEDNEVVTPFTSKGSDFNPVTISGITGELAYNNSTYTFTRSNEGEAKQINERTRVRIKPSFSFDPDKDILVIFSGTYDPYYDGSIFRTITYQNQIVNALGANQYIIVDLTSRSTFEIVDAMNRVLEENHGENYLGFRTYVLNNGLRDAGITQTDQDTNDLAIGEIPSSLRIDGINGNESFHQLLANQLINKMMDLGYITQVDLISN